MGYGKCCCFGDWGLLYGGVYVFLVCVVWVSVYG